MSNSQSRKWTLVINNPLECELMIICSRCKTENEDGVKFCRECGNNLMENVNVLVNEDLESSTDVSNEQVVHTEKQPFN